MICEALNEFGHEINLMGFDALGERRFVIPVSDTQTYRQFGNSVVVPVFQAVAEMMKPRVLASKGKVER